MDTNHFLIRFHANTTGIHHVGYRTYTDPVNTYNVIDVNVTSIGDYEVRIEVPGNLYCAYDGITYEGYIIAACEDQTDANLDGIPDAAITWTVLLGEAEDPCKKTEITCSAVAILSVDIVGDPNCGTTPSGTYPVTITAGVGEEIIPAVVNVLSDGGSMTVEIVNPGLYTVAPVLTVDPLVVICSPNMTFTVVMEPACPTLTLGDYDCAGTSDVSATSDYVLLKDASVILCADDTLLPDLPVNFAIDSLGNCHCEECKNVVVTVSPLCEGDAGKVSYQTCWDNTSGYGNITLISQVLLPNNVYNLGCIIPDTLIIDQGNLTVAPVVVETACA